MPVTPAAAADLPRPSPLLIRLFADYARRYVARHFHALRLSRAGAVPDPGEAPLVIYCNHPSWWDPLVGMHLAMTLFPGRRHRVPMDAAAVARYRFFGRLGFFGVEQNTLAGARRLLAVTAALFEEPRATLWVTPQGRFADPRERPPVFAPGLGHLAWRFRRGLFVPLAVEYPFWEERFPEALARFGAPLDAAVERSRRPEDYTALLAQRLAATQDALAAEAVGRDPGSFEVLLEGRAGVGGVYDLWRRLRALAHGERFRREHGASGDLRLPGEKSR